MQGESFKAGQPSVHTVNLRGDYHQVCECQGARVGPPAFRVVVTVEAGKEPETRISPPPYCDRCKTPWEYSHA